MYSEFKLIKKKNIMILHPCTVLPCILKFITIFHMCMQCRALYISQYYNATK